MKLKKIAAGLLSAVIMAAGVNAQTYADNAQRATGFFGYRNFEIDDYSFSCYIHASLEDDGAYHASVSTWEGVKASYRGSETEIIIPDTVTIPESFQDPEYGEIIIDEGAGDTAKVTGVDSVGDSVEKVTLGKNFASNFSLGVPESGGYFYFIASERGPGNYWGKFNGKSLKTIVIEDNDNVVTDGAAIYNSDKTALLAVAGGIETYTVPKTVRGLRCDLIMESFFPFPYYNSHKSYEVEEGSEYFTAVDGVLFNKEMTELICYPSKKIGDEYTVPSGVRAIGTYAFSNAALKEVNMPDSLVEIGLSFLGCKSLSKAVIPSRLTGFSYGYAVGLLGDFPHTAYNCSSFMDVASDFTIHSTENSLAKKYVEDLKSDNYFDYEYNFVALETNTLKLKDEATNIEVEGDLDEKVSLKVEVKTETDDLHSYNITLVGSDGSEVQPKDSGVIVKIPVPEGFRYVYRVEADGTYTDMWARYTNSSDGAYVEFFTDHFSAYIVSDEELASPPAATPDDENSDNSNNSDDTSGTSSDISDSTDSIDSTDNSGNTNTNPSTGIAIALVPTILAGAVVTVIIRKRK